MATVLDAMEALDTKKRPCLELKFGVWELDPDLQYQPPDLQTWKKYCAYERTKLRTTVEPLRVSTVPLPQPTKPHTPTPSETDTATDKLSSSSDEEAESLPVDGLVSAVVDVGKTMVRGAQTSWHALDITARNAMDEWNERQFYDAFPHLQGQHYVSAFSCSIINWGEEIVGTLTLTNLCLAFSTPNPETQNFSFPLDSVINVQKGLVLPTRKGVPSCFCKLPAPGVVPNCIQVYTLPNCLYQFFHFDGETLAWNTLHVREKENDCTRAFEQIDEAWRQSGVPIPHPEVAAFGKPPLE